MYFITISQPDNEIDDQSKLKAFADNSKFTPNRIENFVGKGENAGYQQYFAINKWMAEYRQTDIGNSFKTARINFLSLFLSPSKCS